MSNIRNDIRITINNLTVSYNDEGPDRALVSNRPNLRETSIYEDAERDLNAKILKVTMTIKDQFPELSKYLEEMPVTIPDEKDPEITLNILKTYYESLNSLLSKYKLEHPEIEEKTDQFGLI